MAEKATPTATPASTPAGTVFEQEKLPLGRDYDTSALSPTVDDELLDSLENTEQVQKIVREGLLLAAGGAAILLQVAMPGVALGVGNHSNFAYRPMNRLETTMTFVYCMAFGSKKEKKAIIEAVHRAHVPVKGPNYSADDPDLQMWVAATLYASGIYLYEEVCGRLDRKESDRIYQEYSVLAVSLRVPPEVWPKDRSAFWRYWDDCVSKLQITPEAQRVAQDLLYNTNLPLYLRVLMPSVRVATAHMLPDSVREAYGLKTNRRRRAAYKSLMTFAKVTYPALPTAVRCYPMKFYMKKMRRYTDKVQ